MRTISYLRASINIDKFNSTDTRLEADVYPTAINYRPTPVAEQIRQALIQERFTRLFDEISYSGSRILISFRDFPQIISLTHTELEKILKVLRVPYDNSTV